MISAIKRELKRVSPAVRIENNQIQEVITQEVMKREVLENEKYRVAEKAIERAATKAARARKDDEVVIPENQSAESATNFSLPTPIVTLGISSNLSSTPSAQ